MRKIINIWCCILSVIISAGTSYAAAVPDPGESVNVPVIMYHSLLDKKTNRWNISPEEFEKDLEYLSQNGYETVFISDLIAYVNTGGRLPEKPVVLTFDDGYYNNLKAIPYLEKYNMRIMLSVIGESSDHWTKHSDETCERYGHLTWAHITEMISSGRVELANHTQSMHKNTGGRDGCCRKKSESAEEYERILSDDVETLQEKMEKISGIRPECFTYPFGNMCKDSDIVLRKLGFKATLSCESGINVLRAGDEDCLFRMKRNNRTPGETLEDILKNLKA
ncbi:MAG: polysaccharide deacetylase family protein [Oscillospiraceae bacterium]|nr:polysaccharide deacetylase family protein [Oscillospiraceae bacterium]